MASAAAIAATALMIGKARWSVALLILGVMLQPGGGLAQKAPAPRFDIARFVVDGNTLLAAQEIERAVAPYTGKNKDFADIQRALEALEQAYRGAGWGIV